MIVRRVGGMTEFIPSPKEKREGVIRDHTLCLLANLHRRLLRLEEEFGLPLAEAGQCESLLERIQAEEASNDVLNEQLLAAGESHQSGQN